MASPIEVQPRGGRESFSAEAWIAHWADPYNASDVHGMLVWLHPQVEFRPLLLGEWEEVYRGRAGVAEWLLRARNLEPKRSLLVDEVRPLPDARFLVVGTMVFGDTVRARFCGLNELRDGLLVGVQHWLTTPEALQHVGHID
jgi:hypothetical protein